MSSRDIAVRPVGVDDLDSWSALWAGYLAFYDTALDAATTAATWERLLAGRSYMIGLVAVESGTPVGLVHCVVHPSTWSTQQVGYLEDLFVDPDHRGMGIGRLLIEAVVDRGRQEGWSQIHWITAADNEAARRLYRRLASETDWVRYEIELPTPPGGR